MGYNAQVKGRFQVVNTPATRRVLARIGQQMEAMKSVDHDTLLEIKSKDKALEVKINFGGWFYHGYENRVIKALTRLSDKMVAGHVHWKSDYEQTRGHIHPTPLDKLVNLAQNS